MINKEYIVAKHLLSGTGIGMIEAARLVLEAVEQCGNSIVQIREGLRLAARELHRHRQTVPFSTAVLRSLEGKAHRRPRTLADIRQMTARMIRQIPGLSEKPLRSLTADDCRSILDTAFHTPRQRYKARAILSGIFSYGLKRNWCSENPVENVEVPVLRESEVRPLTPEELGRLIKQAEQDDGGACVPAVALMAYAGIRPREVERLTWADIDLEEGVVSLLPTHAKTGGSRHVTIQPVLRELLEKWAARSDIPICPRNWSRRWKKLRLEAGWEPGSWQQDCLRHTYASYHAKYFRNFGLLQIEMGHASSNLLRTRYLNMQGITRERASQFWNGGLPPMQAGQIRFQREESFPP